MISNLSSYFSNSYREAREKFLSAVMRLDLLAESHAHPSRLGTEGERLAMDVVRLGPASSPRMLLVTSGTHGIEGFAGSGCQLSLLHDQELLDQVQRGDTAVLIVHAVNPYGFSHLQRVNEDNVDLNRNFLDFSKPLPPGGGYESVHELVVPAVWPPTVENEAAIESYKNSHGARAFQSAVMGGQTTHPNGIFFAGHQATWSNLTLRSILREHGRGCTSVAWIDIHTGLGPWGHGEKIYAGRNDAREFARARACWGADIFSPYAGNSIAEVVHGIASSAIYDECPGAASMSIGLEFGTRDFNTMIRAVRGDQWLANHPGASQQTRELVKKEIRDAFYVDSPEWRGMAIGQSRVALLQALHALQGAAIGAN